MAGSLTSWPRPHYAPGGGNALLYYKVFGNFDLSHPLNLQQYHTAGQPSWLDVQQYHRSRTAEPFPNPPSDRIWEVLTRDSPLLAAQAEQAPQCVIVRGEVTDPPTLDYLRDTIGIVMWLLDSGGIAVSDPQMLWLWSPDEWREEVFESHQLHADRHTAIMVSPEPGGTSWYHTRGMRKFGRPDLSVRGVNQLYASAVLTLIERFIEFQALGAIIPEGEDVRVKALPPGGRAFHRGNLDDPEFNNTHVAIEWPGGLQ